MFFSMFYYVLHAFTVGFGLFCICLKFGRCDHQLGLSGLGWTRGAAFAARGDPRPRAKRSAGL